MVQPEKEAPREKAKSKATWRKTVEKELNGMGLT